MVEINDKLNIPIKYSKLYITVEFSEDVKLSENKVSAIRGGIGEMLLCENCIRNRKCSECEFTSECIVQRILYSSMDIEPRFMGKGDSVAYVIECENYKRNFKCGEQLKFQIIIFGKVLVYFSQIIHAVSMLGMNGLGTHKARFHIIAVDNDKGEHILENSSIYMERYRIESVEDYVQRRLRDLNNRERLILKFVTPLSIKYHGEFLQNFDIASVMNAIRRRIYILLCFEGIEDEELYSECDILPEQIRECSVKKEVLRYSNRRSQSMKLRGITGEMEIQNVSSANLKLLLAGELIHIGKNTSFGFGRYEI